MQDFVKLFARNRSAQLALLLLIGSTAWWMYLHMSGASDDALQVWAASYQVIAWFGAIAGLVISKRWGGWMSAVGRSVLAFSIGLLLQGFGQSSYSYYIYYLHSDIPYPSMGDIGFFGSVLFYIYGSVVLMRIVGSRMSLATYKGKIVAVILPVILLSISYFIFLQEYEADWSDTTRMFLDFGYPLGQAIYVSVALLAFLFSRNIMGGKMRLPMLLFIIALCAQYVADFVFLLQASWGTWTVGGINDFIYSISYFLMSIALIYLGYVFRNISENQNSDI